MRRRAACTRCARRALARRRRARVFCPHGQATAQGRDPQVRSSHPALPLMALRSTIVYPLGTIAVQMGAPENLSLLRAYDEPGTRRRPRRRRRRSRRPHRLAALHRTRRRRGARARANQSSRRHGADHASGAAAHRHRRDQSGAAISRRGHPASEGNARRSVGARRSRHPRDLLRRDARRADRAHSGRSAGDPQDEHLGSGPVRRSRRDEHELPHLRQGRGAAAPRRRTAPAVHPQPARARSRAGARDGRREAPDRDQDRAAPARVLSAPAAARDSVGARRGRSGREGSGRAAQEDRRSEAARARRPGSAARDGASSTAQRRVERVSGHSHVSRLDARAAVEQAQRRRRDRAHEGRRARSTTGTTA